MELKNGALKDDFPFQLADFLVPTVHFQGCISFIPQFRGIHFHHESVMDLKE